MLEDVLAALAAALPGPVFVVTTDAGHGGGGAPRGSTASSSPPTADIPKPWPLPSTRPWPGRRALPHIPGDVPCVTRRGDRARVRRRGRRRDLRAEHVRLRDECRARSPHRTRCRSSSVSPRSTITCSPPASAASPRSSASCPGSARHRHARGSAPAPRARRAHAERRPRLVLAPPASEPLPRTGQMKRYEVIGVEGLPEIGRGDDLAGFIHVDRRAGSRRRSSPATSSCEPEDRLQDRGAPRPTLRGRAPARGPTA